MVIFLLGIIALAVVISASRRVPGSS